MTWSILARDGDGRFGIAIASRFFAVGALTMHTRRGAGALATQAIVSRLGKRGGFIAGHLLLGGLAHGLDVADFAAHGRSARLYTPS